MRRAALALVVAPGMVAAAIGLGGCTSEGGTPQLRETADRGYVAGDGSVVVLQPGERGEPVDVSGETLDGEQLDLEQLRGRAVVLNVWGSWCAPCRAEAPDLVAAHDTFDGQAVTFVGIDINDASTTNAIAFEESFGIPYQSIYDPDGVTLLALRGDIPPKAIPSTLVLDRSGAVAARVLGRVERSTLVGLVENVLAEPSPGA